MEQQLILQILRNGENAKEIKEARMAAADEIERLQRTDLRFDLIDSRLETIEGMLRQLLSLDIGSVPVTPASDIYTEIARVKAAGIDLRTYLKERARRSMQQEAAEKKLRRGSKSKPKRES